MPVRKIVYVGDERLSQKAQTIKQFAPDLQTLAADMIETMRCHAGVGLAGPQIGVMQRIFVAEIPLPDDNESEPHPQSGKTYILINPEIVKTSSMMAESEEGCLSMPNWRGLVNRHEWVRVKARDVNGRHIKLKLGDLLGRIFQHEIDHLNGIMYTDHISEADKLWQTPDEDCL